MSKVAKATIALMIVTIISKILGFGREVVLGAAYGTTSYSDIYITAMNIPSVLFSAIGTAIATTFIPLYYENENIGGKKKSLIFTNNIFNIIFVIGIVISGLAFLFTDKLVGVFAIGFEGEKLVKAIEFTRIMILGGLAIILSNIISSYLQIKEEFIIPGLVGLPFNIIIIISIILSVKINIYILPIGTLIAMTSQLLFQMPFAYKKGYKYVPTINLKDEYIKKMVWLVTPVFIGVGVNQVNAMIDRTLASTLFEGAISALNYANRLNLFVTGLFIVSISAVVYPMLSKLSSYNDNKEFSETVAKSVNSVILLVIPASIGAIALAKPIVKVLFERGAFDATATDMTAIALIFYSIGMVSFGLRDILGKVFYSLQDTKTPMVNGALAMITNIILNIILVKYMGHAGLAFATSLSAIFCIILLFRSLNKKIGNFGQKKIIKVFIKSLIASLIMGVITRWGYNMILATLGVGTIYEVMSLFISIIIGIIVYSILIMTLKIEEVTMIKEMTLSKIKNK